MENQNVDDVFTNELMISLVFNRIGNPKPLDKLKEIYVELKIKKYKEFIDKALNITNDELESLCKSLVEAKNKDNETMKFKLEKKKERGIKFMETYVQKSPVYENCSLLAPNGQILWYYLFFVNE